jgi:hypothetical protein
MFIWKERPGELIGRKESRESGKQSHYAWKAVLNLSLHHYPYPFTISQEVSAVLLLFSENYRNLIENKTDYWFEHIDEQFL